MRIGELAHETGASTRSLRHYESLGLICSERESNGYRSFGPSTVADVRRIRSLLESGFGLRAIATILPCLQENPTLQVQMCPAVAAQVREAIVDIEGRQSELTRRRAAIEALIGQ
ncbi:MerR family transcriptional regulator [Dermacoccaceae bacterium W4C1]